MKTKLFAAALGGPDPALPALLRRKIIRGRGDDDWRDGRGDWRGTPGNHHPQGWPRHAIRPRRPHVLSPASTRPFNFQPGLTYAYTDRCNRQGCVAFVFDGRHRRPVDRIFAPHLRDARLRVA